MGDGGLRLRGQQLVDRLGEAGLLRRVAGRRGRRGRPSRVRRSGRVRVGRVRRPEGGGVGQVLIADRATRRRPALPRSDEPTASTVAACAARESSIVAASTEPGKTDTEGSAGLGRAGTGRARRWEHPDRSRDLGGRRPAGSAAGDEPEGSDRPDGTGGGEQERATRPPAGRERGGHPQNLPGTSGRSVLPDRMWPRSRERSAAGRTQGPDAATEPRTACRRAARRRARCRDRLCGGRHAR